MAQNRLTYDQACELVSKWYFTMRVEFLTDDELDHELKLRSVIVDSSFSTLRKRKCLRDMLKIEGKDGIGKFTGTLKGDPQREMTTCSAKFTEIKSMLGQAADAEQRKVCYARLLHVGVRVQVLLATSRGSPNLHSHMQNMLVEIVELLEPVYDQHQITVSPVQTESSHDDNSGAERSLPPTPSEHQTVDGVNNDEQDFCEDQPNPTSVLSQEDIDFIRSLQLRIFELEADLNRRRKGREIATQTDPYPAPIPPQHPYHPLQNSPDFQWQQFHSKNPTLPNHHTSFSVGHGNHPAVTNNPTHNQNSYPPFNITYPQNFPIPESNPPPNLSYNIPTTNPPQYPTPFRGNDFQPSCNHFPPAQFPVSYQNRHTLPVSKWNIEKYAGDDQGLRLNEFLEVVQVLAQAENVSEGELFESAVHLFSGSALKWYMTQRTTGRLMNWQHLVFELRRTYMHPDLDSLIKMKIYQRRQQRLESFHEFYFEVEKMCRSMSVQIPEYEKMQILQQNMRLDYKRQMTFIPVADLQTLLAAGQKLDALNFSAYNKVFGADKTVHALQENGSGVKNKSRDSNTQSQFSRSGQTVSRTQQQTKTSKPTRQPPQYFQNTGVKQNRASSQQTGVQTSSRLQHETARETATKSPVAGPSGFPSRPTLTLEDVVKHHKPPPDGTCFNCGRFGHHSVMCRLPRDTFCNTCGLHGFPTDFCPYCIKNRDPANTNRGSQM